MEQALLDFSAATGIRALLFSHWGWPIAESIHFIGLSLLIGTVGIFDLRMLGLMQGIPLMALHRFVPVGVVGYLLNVTTGIMFVTTFPDQYIYNPAFQTKLAFMLLAGVNMVVFYRFCFRELQSADVSVQSLRLAMLFALISLICWVAVITGCRLITFFRPPHYWCFWCG